MIEKKKEPEMVFRYLLKYMIQRRWFITALVLGSFVLIIGGIFAAISSGIQSSSEWKELLLLLLGAFIGSYGKIIDFWFTDQDRDKMLSQKADEEDGISLSHTNDMKETNKEPTPLIPDAFIQGAVASRELSKVENVQKFEIAKVEQAHEHKMEELEFEYHAHRQCEHIWGDSDHDGHDECQTCGLLKENVTE
jgi:hypothetical protein